MGLRWKRQPLARGGEERRFGPRKNSRPPQLASLRRIMVGERVSQGPRAQSCRGPASGTAARTPLPTRRAVRAVLCASHSVQRAALKPTAVPRYISPARFTAARSTVQACQCQVWLTPCASVRESGHAPQTAMGFARGLGGAGMRARRRQEVKRLCTRAHARRSVYCARKRGGRSGGEARRAARRCAQQL